MGFSGCVRAWLLAVTFLGPSAAGAAERVEVPLRQRVLSNGDIRYFVDLSLGNSGPIAVMVDTGSVGLRILSDVVPDKAFASISDTPSVYGYGSGVRLNGVIATLRIALGHRSGGAEPISVQRVRTVDCFPKQPNCPASRLSPEDYRIGGDGLPKEGFGAILGIGMGSGPVDNPLRQLGAQAWIVELPRPDDNRAGRLILNPDANEVADYTLFPTGAILQNLPRGAAFHDAIPGCLRIPSNQRTICGLTLLDTGAPGIRISSRNQENRGGWKKGDQLAIVFRNRQGGTVQGSFRAGANRASQFSTSEASDDEQKGTRISAGTLPYFLFSAWYDDQRQLVGLRAR